MDYTIVWQLSLLLFLLLSNLKLSASILQVLNSPIYKVNCASDPTIDNKIRFASGQVFHDGYELTRQEKVKVVVDYFSSTKTPVNIRVCFKNKENCCSCEKCLRTIVGIIAEGKDPRDFGFKIPSNISQHIKISLDNEVKFFSDAFIIIYWEMSQRRLKENYQNILFKDILKWFISYDFKAERKRALLNYRVKYFFPIIKRKLKIGLNRILARDI